MSVLLNTRQAAAHCNLSPRTLEKLRVKGGGPHFLRLGGAVRYQLEDLDLWIASSRRRTTSEELSPQRSPSAPALKEPSPLSAPGPTSSVSGPSERLASGAPQRRPPSGRRPRGNRRSRERHPQRSRRS
jgi:hypothetical protein